MHAPQLLTLLWTRSQGTIEKGDKEGYKCSGIIERTDDNTVEITELPIRTWTQSYKEMLEGWVAGTDKQPAWVKVRVPLPLPRLSPLPTREHDLTNVSSSPPCRTTRSTTPSATCTSS